MSRKFKRKRARLKDSRQGKAAPPAETGALIAAANRFLAAGKPRKALELLDPTLKAQPGDGDLLLAYGVALFQAGRAEESAATLLKATQRQPDNARAHVNLGVALTTLERFDEAEAAFDQATQRQPDYPQAWNGLGVARQGRNRDDEAETAFREALRLSPGHPEFLTNLGELHLAREAPDSAEECFNQALESAPDDLKALNGLGGVALQRNDQEEALACFQRVLTLDPRDQAALGNAGACLQRQQDWEGALPYVKKLLALNPASVDAINKVGALLLKMGLIDKAVGRFRYALTLDPESADTHLHLALALHEAGEMAAARDAVADALRLRPDFPKAALLRANLKKHAPEETRERESLTTLLERPDRSGEEQSQLHFALGKINDDQGRYEVAFHHYSEGNRLVRADLGFDHDTRHRQMERIRALFTPEFLRDRAELGSDAARPVFVVGMPRSGTTLVHQILASHSRAAGAGELYDLPQLATALAKEGGAGRRFPDGVADLDRTRAGAMAASYLKRLEAVSPDAEVVIDKLPDNHRQLGLIGLLFPRARIIHCRRNPLDIALSIFFLNFEDLSFSFSLEDIAAEYRDYAALMAHWETVFPGRIHHLDYEALIGDQERESRRLLDFLGLEWEEACLSFQRARTSVATASAWQVRQPLYSRSVERWRNYEPYFGALREMLTG